jgi:hypothetical protein
VPGAGSSPTVPVTVVPAPALDSYRRLLWALEQAFPVRFRAGGREPPRGVKVSFIAEGHSAVGNAGDRAVYFLDGHSGSAPAVVELARGELLAPALRGATMTEDGGVQVLTRPPGERSDVLAATSGDPLWVRRDLEDWCVLAPMELGPGAPLRAGFRDGVWLGLLPLVHWLSEVAPARWTPPAPRAAFLFDDPNLHWTSYGFINYGELLEHAKAHDYAATMAVIPRDLWWTHPAAARLFRGAHGRLSLALHGNDHVKRELEQPLSREARRALLAQALRRADAFEARSGVTVARVMVPPHGSTSREMVIEMPGFGIEAMSDSRPFPWLAAPPPEAPLAGWHPVDVVDGGLPVVPRYHLTRSRDDLRLRAFLGQPLILYGHHTDLAAGPDVLVSAADDIRAAAPIEWLPVGEIARSNYLTRLEGGRVLIKLLNPVAEVRVPDAADEVVIDAGLLGPCTALDIVDDGQVGRVTVQQGKTEPAPLKGRILRLRVVRPPQSIADKAPRAPFRPYPLLRRLASEGRDRVMPLTWRKRTGR